MRRWSRQQQQLGQEVQGKMMILSTWQQYMAGGC
jgi:hypothetical protein